MPRAIYLSLLTTLCSCEALNGLKPLSESDRLDQEISLERKRQELDALRRQGQPSPVPAATTSQSSTSPISTPAASNQGPQIQVLDAVLATTVKNDDTVKIIVKATDADGDLVEYNWSSVYAGLSSTKGEQVVWFPGDQELAGKTNIITVNVTDKKGGTSTASLNIFVQNDGTLLVREDTAHKPVLNSLLATRTTDNRLVMRASASDPAGGVLRYSWSASAGKLSTPSTASTIWEAGSETGEISLQLSVRNDAGLETIGSFSFRRQADGSLSGGFTGTDISLSPLPNTGPIGSDAGTFQLLGRLLVCTDEELSRFDPLTRTRQSILKLADLPNPAGTRLQLRQLLTAADGSKAWLVFEQGLLTAAQLQNVVFEVDLAKGEARQVATMVQHALVDGMTLGAQGARYLLAKGGLQAIFDLYGPPEAGRWLGAPDGSSRQTRISADFDLLDMSASGKWVARRQRSDSDQLLVYDPQQGSESPLLDLRASLGQGAFAGGVWNHKGDSVAFALAGYNGFGSSSYSVYSLNLAGQVKKLQSVQPSGGISDLAWSPDDLAVSFMSYATSANPGSSIVQGELLIRPIDSEQLIKPSLTLDNNAHAMTWVP
ncbi:MAG TPA: hypothetical protein V6D23_19405 [Candidatus Obscuribacterales bacterium]